MDDQVETTSDIERELEASAADRGRRAGTVGSGDRQGVVRPAIEAAVADAFATLDASETGQRVTPTPTADETVLSPAVPAEIPARMLNEFVYCPRLFYYEFVEGVFVESADTLRGSAIHSRVDRGKGDMPPAGGAPRRKAKAVSESDDAAGKDDAPAGKPETIHSRSVQMGSDRLGVVAKMDLVETQVKPDDLFSPLEVCPVDYKAGAPREGTDCNELWDTDRIQLGVQALILRDNGYTCREGVIFYRTTRQRVRLPITPELEAWVIEQIAAVRVCARGPIPAPLVRSPKCVRCSLAPVCLPDETRMLAAGSAPPDPAEPSAAPAQSTRPPRRLMAARSDERALYLTTPGLRVGCKSELLEIRDADSVLDRVRLRDLDHVALFGNIQITTQAVQTLCESEIPLTYFSMGGWFYGITEGHGLKNVFLRIQQFRTAGEPASCLRLARRFVAGKVRNHRTLLMRNHVEPPAPVLAKLKHACSRALSAGGHEELLGIEGAAAALYFEHFAGMIKHDVEDELPGLESNPGTPAPFFDFNFTGRNRRPPVDPVNACLSLAYSLLAKDCLLAVRAVGFDPYVGFYHQPRFGRPALALDLMEEFRPLIAESVVLTAINTGVLAPTDFVRAGHAVNLSTAGRKRFFQVYEQRLGSLLTHPVFNYKVSYRRALELQARLLARALTGEISEYFPLITR